mmetsp:Transcript_6121/g.18472  ORF Transcript_6121/g.18472 Transcript_6121/m.18472 type:complete len:211 (+) Transcript_6121:912-1544(+)
MGVTVSRVFFETTFWRQSMTLLATAAQNPTASNAASAWAQTTRPAMTGTRESRTCGLVRMPRTRCCRYTVKSGAVLLTVSVKLAGTCLRLIRPRRIEVIRSVARATIVSHSCFFRAAVSRETSLPFFAPRPPSTSRGARHPPDSVRRLLDDRGVGGDHENPPELHTLSAPSNAVPIIWHMPSCALVAPSSERIVLFSRRQPSELRYHTAM